MGQHTPKNDLYLGFSLSDNPDPTLKCIPLIGVYILNSIVLLIYKKLQISFQITIILSGCGTYFADLGLWDSGNMTYILGLSWLQKLAIVK